MNISHPKFAVVGHPNKGKSSIVSSLALDDSVYISNIPGATTKKRSFPLSVDGKILYELFDTPGFQRARAVLAWLQKHDVSADKKYEVLRAFIHTHKDNPRFNDEIELLSPIMDGAGIIYVVDASKPYGQEYEAEMEILRWTGEPSMALINHIDESDYSSDWKRALGQYFKMVRTYNPMHTSVKQHISILESMAQLKEEWIDSVKASIKAFEEYHQQMLDASATVLARLVYESISLKTSLGIKGEDATEEEKDMLKSQYKQKLRELESKAQKAIEDIWKHKNLQKEQEALTFDGLDLFSEEMASVFGLTRKELIVVGASSGAVTGGGIDLFFVGHTMFLGGAIGAIAGGVGAYFGFDKLFEIKVIGQSLGKRSLKIGPMKSQNFPYILLGRALYHTAKVLQRSHATRENLNIKMDASFKKKWLDYDMRKKLEKQHKEFRKIQEAEAKSLEEYEDLIKEALKRLS